MRNYIDNIENESDRQTLACITSVHLNKFYFYAENLNIGYMKKYLKWS